VVGVEPILVRHALGTYPVYISRGALSELPDIVAAHCGARAVALVTDAAVGRQYEAWESGANESWQTPGRMAGPAHEWATRLSVAPGEKSKTRENWAMLTDALLDQGFGRDTALIGLGGGVVGDLTGFVAATYHRGIPFVLVPTTLLAMLDASVGGKTGVDTKHGKNLIGAFHPPVAVVVDPATLRSLSAAEFSSGLSEAVKHGLIADAGYLSWIEANTPALLARDLGALEVLIRRSVEIKATVVADDERESGPRALLNAGHTVAHALEVVSGYTMLHGQAVGLGLVAECAMGEAAGLLPSGTSARIRSVLEALGLPVRVPFRTNSERVRQAMLRDKKNVGGEIRFALPVEPGRMESRDGSWTVAVDDEKIDEGLAVIL
jgi:3-dehydroquinate synthase